MQVREFSVEAQLDQIPSGLIAFDLELANSFTQSAPVICMIGTEVYLPRERRCLSRIGYVTQRDEEPALIDWFIDSLGEIAAAHGEPKLLSFSGQENDIPWIQQRLERFQVPAPRRAVFGRFQHVDLKAEFYRRTHSDHMSLKNLERIFGIERESGLQSRKVSFILTDIVRGKRADGGIPEKVFQYLHQDVHHLMLIYNRWGEVSLEQFRLTEVEYVSFLNAMRNALRKLVTSPLRRRRDTERAVKALEKYQAAFDAAMDAALMEENFSAFELPPLPELDCNHPEITRIARKHARLQTIQIRDERTGAYLLRQTEARPMGALAVVRRNGKVLMIRRAAKLERAAGFWGLPGGTVDNGEKPEAAALRELREELNLEGRAGRVLGQSTSLSGEYTLHWVEVEVDDPGALRPAPQEVAEVRWVAPGEVKQLDPLIPGALEGFRRFLGDEWA
jgi:8-oxo-dGTP pyrophosphatase MutT (NUDIX family)